MSLLLILAEQCNETTWPETVAVVAVAGLGLLCLITFFIWTGWR